MEKQPYKNMDERMREAVRWQEEPAYNERHWAALEKALGQQKKKPFMGWWWLVMPVALVAGIFYSISLSDQVSLRTIKPGRLISEQETRVAASLNKPLPEVEYAKDIMDDQVLNYVADRARSEIATTMILHKVKEGESGNNNKTNENELDQPQRQGLNQEEWNANQALNVEIPSATVDISDTTVRVDETEKVIAKLKQDAQSSTTKSEIRNDQHAQLLMKHSNQQKKKGGNPRGFYVIPSVGMEWSKVRDNAAGKTSLQYGLLARYHINNRWAVQTGIMVTNKLYTAGSGEYYFQPGSYYTQVKIQQIEADCRVIEIPVMARFYCLQQSGKSKLSFGFGFNNSIMIEEEYDIHYTRINGSYGNAYKTFETGKTQIFSGLIFDTEYTRAFGKRLSLSLAPQLKIATTGVGEGQVKINSLGLLGGIGIKL